MTGAMAATGGIGWNQRWRQREFRHALPVCAAASLVLHLMLINLGQPFSEKAQSPVAHAGSVGTLQARLIQRPVPAPQVSEALVPAPDASTAADLVRPKAKPPVERSEAHHGLPRQAAPDHSATAAETPILSHSSTPALSAAEEEGEYIPRPQLSVVPVAQGPVIVSAPLGVTEVTRITGVLSLFIDEDGEVQRIKGEEPRLPEVFEAAAREAFMAARFSPGQLNGKAVKSRVRVEVVFDNTPLSGP